MHVQDSYAYRDAVTDVIIKSLRSPNRTRLKCGQYVKQVAVYDNLVAVFAAAEITVYERGKGEGQFRVLAKLPQSAKCSVIMLTRQHVTICQGRIIRCFMFLGQQCALLTLFTICSTIENASSRVMKASCMAWNALTCCEASGQRHDGQDRVTLNVRIAQRNARSPLDR